MLSRLGPQLIRLGGLSSNLRGLDLWGGRGLTARRLGALLVSRMNQVDQQNAFYSDLDKLIQRYVDEFDLTTASAIGVLEIHKNQLLMDQMGVAYIEDEDYEE